MTVPPLAFLIIITVLQLFEERTVVQFFAYVFCPKSCTKTWISAKYSFLPMFFPVLHRQKPVQLKRVPCGTP
jgi:hypothetical protein